MFGSDVDSVRLASLAERPDLAASIPAILAETWPRPMIEGRPGVVGQLVDLTVERAPQHQVVMVDGDQILGVGLAVPMAWDGEDAGLPQGWDGALAASASLVERGGTPTALCALSITVTEPGRGEWLSERMILGLRSAAYEAGAGALIAPVRPSLKHLYPLIPMEQYLRWSVPGGGVFDAEVRRHLVGGGRQAPVVEPSITITAPVDQWEAWTGMALPGSGDHIIPGGLAPLQVDREAGTATYLEPAVWIIHPAA